MIEKLIEQQETIKAMQDNEDSAIKVMQMYEDCKKRIDRAIEYIGHAQNYGKEKVIYVNGNDILEILKGDYINE